MCTTFFWDASWIAVSLWLRLSIRTAAFQCLNLYKLKALAFHWDDMKSLPVLHGGNDNVIIQCKMSFCFWITMERHCFSPPQWCRPCRVPVSAAYSPVKPVISSVRAARGQSAQSETQRKGCQYLCGQEMTVVITKDQQKKKMPSIESTNFLLTHN